MIEHLAYAICALMASGAMLYFRSQIFTLEVLDRCGLSAAAGIAMASALIMLRAAAAEK